MDMNELNQYIEENKIVLPFGMNSIGLLQKLKFLNIPNELYKEILYTLNEISNCVLDKPEFVTTNLVIDLDNYAFDSLLDSISVNGQRIKFLDKLLIKKYITNYLAFQIKALAPSGFLSAILNKSKNEKRLLILEPIIQCHELIIQENVDSCLLEKKFLSAINAGFNINNSILLILGNYSKKEFPNNFI